MDLQIPTTSVEREPQMAVNDHIIIFEHANFRGHHRHIFGSEANLNDLEDNTLENKVSSFVVVSGNWSFFKNAGFMDGFGVGPFPGTSGVNAYPTLPAGIANDTITSLSS
jgi:hypothetical protein